MSIDLHCHTLFSIDSYGTPENLIDAAISRGVQALSITDHNHLGGLERASAFAKKKGIQFFPGVELDVIYQNYHLHFLGLGVDNHGDALNQVIKQNQSVYSAKFEIYYQNITELGFPYSREQIVEHLPIRYPTNPDPILTEYVVKYIIDQHDRNEELLKMHVLASQNVVDHFVELYKDIRFCDYAVARDAVHAANGVFLLAHIGSDIHGFEKQIKFIQTLAKEGMDGFELYHYLNIQEPEYEKLVEWGQASSLIISGGSDCGHGGRPHETHIGNCTAPESLAVQLDRSLSHRY